MINLDQIPKDLLATFPRTEFIHSFKSGNVFTINEPTSNSTEVTIKNGANIVFDFSNNFLPLGWELLTIGAAEEYFDEIGFHTNVKPWSTYTEYEGKKINTIVLGYFDEEDGGMRNLLTLFHERSHVLRHEDYVRRRTRVRDEQDSLRMLQAWEEVGAWTDAFPDFIEMCKNTNIPIQELFPDADDMKLFVHNALNSSYGGLWEVYKSKLDRNIEKLFN